MEFSRREYWNGLPFPSPEHLPNPDLLHCRQTLYRLSHQGSSIKGKQTVIFRDVNGLRVCHTEWSKAEKQILYAYMWNLKKWYQWAYLKSRNRDTDVENKPMNTKEKRWSRMNWDVGVDIYTVLCIKQITNENRLYSTGNSSWCSVVT